MPESVYWLQFIISMRPSNLFFFVLFILSGYLANAQTEQQWEAYLAMYEKGPGSTTVNMELISYAPKKSLPFVLITGVTVLKCTDDGFPEKEEFDRLYNVSDLIQSEISKFAKMEHVGTFTYQCQRLDYIYLSDTTQIRTQLAKLYTSNFSNYTYYINLKSDGDWEAYLQFLYPNEETQEYMSNDKVIVQLSQAGDRLTTAREVDHWLYFSTIKDRDAFEKIAISDGFKIKGKQKINDTSKSYLLNISRTDKVDHDSISPITLALRKKARQFNGYYDGWETFIVKD